MRTPDERKDVRDFFQGYAKEFQGIYTGEEKGGVGRFLDAVLRSSMFSRFEKAFAEIEACGAKTVLDVGCGPGTHDVMLAKKLRTQVTGVDVASSMIELARNNAEKTGVSELCRFVVGDFDGFGGNTRFDAVLSVGVVEYIKEPGPFVRKMFDLAKKKVIFSLPVKWHLLTPQRALRYRLRNCPLWFYSRFQISGFLKAHGMDRFRIHDLGRDFLIVVDGIER